MGNSVDLRKRNKKNLVFSIIKNQKNVSKTVVKRVSRLSMATVLQCIEELKQEGLIYESGIGESTGGRKPTWLTINPDGGYFIGVEFTSDKILCVMLNAASQVVYSQRINVTANTDADRFISLIKMCIQNAFDYSGEYKDKIRGIGIGVPGYIDIEKGTGICFEHIKGWKNIKIAETISRLFGIPTYIEENVNAMALAFKWYNNKQNAKNILFISIRTGVGMGCILQNELLYGEGSQAGEIGHLRVSDKEKVCYCGKCGCLDTEISYKSIEDKVRDRMEDGKTAVLNEYLENNSETSFITAYMKLVAENDPDALDIYKECIYYLGRATGDAITLFAPERIVFSGDITQTNLFLPLITEEINKNVMNTFKGTFTVEKSELGENIGAIGAASLVIQKQFRYMNDSI